MDLSLLNTLKKKMNEAKVFSEVWEYFLDNFGEKDEFHKVGQRWPLDPNLIMAINESAKALGMGSLRLEKTILVGIPEYGFVHGGTFIDRYPTSILYFPAINKGMLSISMINKGEFETKFVRFTSHGYYDGLHRSVN